MAKTKLRVATLIQPSLVANWRHLERNLLPIVWNGKMQKKVMAQNMDHFIHVVGNSVLRWSYVEPYSLQKLISVYCIVVSLLSVYLHNTCLIFLLPINRYTQCILMAMTTLIIKWRWATVHHVISRKTYPNLSSSTISVI